MPRSRSHADSMGRRIWQRLREPRIEFRMKKSNRALSLSSCSPGPGRSVGSCPAAKFARGPKIRAVPCAQACRRSSTLSESSESFIWRARGVQASRAPPEEGRALARGVLRNGNEELGRAPEPSGAARSSGGSALMLAFAKLQRRFGHSQLVAPDSVSAVSCSYPPSRGAESWRR